MCDIKKSIDIAWIPDCNYWTWGMYSTWRSCESALQKPFYNVRRRAENDHCIRSNWRVDTNSSWKIWSDEEKSQSTEQKNSTLISKGSKNKSQPICESGCQCRKHIDSKSRSRFKSDSGFLISAPMIGKRGARVWKIQVDTSLLSRYQNFRMQNFIQR